jgi:transposase
MPFRLSVTEIRHRLQTLRNYQRLHQQQKVRIQSLETELRQVRTENAALRQQNETLLIRLGELEEKIFGKQRNTDSGAGHSSSHHHREKKKEPRKPASFQRPVPPEDPTDIQMLAVSTCTHCGGQLCEITTHVRYVEDIILPQLLGTMTKTVTKLSIERGYCTHCGVWTAAKDLRGAVVQLGASVKLLICYLTTILDCSYEQVKTLTTDLYGLTISDGEISSILREQSLRWLPEYERLKTEVRAGPGAHVDETTWPIQAFAHHCFAWVMSAVNSPIRVYKLATSRGKGHALELLGEVSETFVRITDCFPGYKRLAGLHQICWAHLHRKIRDLVDNKNLPADKLPAVAQWYAQFSGVYEQLRAYVQEPFDAGKRARQTRHLRAKIHELRQPSAADPKKLADLKVLLAEYDHALFTCMQFQGIPCDNNRAERDLRPLVIKRKKSFGSRTEAGARALEILLSVCWSTWHQHRGNFLPALAKLQR